MAEAYGTREFGTGDLEGIAQYMRQRAAVVKKRSKRDVFIGYAVIAERAADRIVDLEHFKQTALRLDDER